MNNFLKPILIASTLSLFLCLIIFGITSHDSSNKTQIENSQNLETVFFLHISKNTVIQRDTIIEFPELNEYGDAMVKLKGEHFFKTTHSNLGSESKFDFTYFDKFRSFLYLIDKFYYIDSIIPEKSSDNLFILSSGGKPIFSLFEVDSQDIISFSEYLEFKSIIQNNLENTHVFTLNRIFHYKIESLIKTFFSSILPDSTFNVNEALNIITFFEIIENNKPFSSNDYIKKVQQEFVSQFNYEVNTLLHSYTVHYNTVVNFDTEKNIENFKLNNYIKVPKNDNDVCFVKIPDNVEIDYSTIGEINFTFKGYTLDAYNCNEK
tara:strand:+ start:18824 stop:19783 length:960 start_codon:yes stop_codon:yes gene_type:complete